LGNIGSTLSRCVSRRHHQHQSVEVAVPRTPASAARRIRRHLQLPVQRWGACSVSESELEALKRPDFSNWDWPEEKLAVFLRAMFHDLRLTGRLGIGDGALDNFLVQVYQSYNRVPFHNFQHCFMVTQMVYCLVCADQLWLRVPRLELLCLLTAAACHDLDHPGLSNHWQRSAGTGLSACYGPEATLERHHLATAMSLVGRGLLSGLTAQEFRYARRRIARLILATDLARHSAVMAEFQEFFAEARLERSQGIEPLAVMDPERFAGKAKSQCGFIGGVALPMNSALARVLPCATECLLAPVQQQLRHYTDLLASTGSQQAQQAGGSELFSSN
uniref:PDEase domain-containing protein n=1 Tax=Macrostomum lignano TaxID=282301 RepID=A0A1I8HWP6_9PLAT